MLLEDFVDLLEGVRKSGTEWKALCPAHDDRKPSLAVRDGEDRILVKCMSNDCPPEAIVGALGLTMGDLFYEKRGGEKQLEATEHYEYTDENGDKLFRVVRKPGKQFRQERWEDGEWKDGRKGIPTVPYRLADLVLLNPGDTVYIVEGEKDVHSVYEAGAVATTNPGGAGKWQSTWGEYFKDLDVVIIADRDEPGRKHAKQVYESLLDVAQEVCIMQAKEGKDITDHLNNAWGFDDLELLDESELPVESDGVVLRKFSHIEARDVEWIEGFENMFAYGAIATIVGLPGVNKSTLSALVAKAVTRNGRPVVFLASEDDPRSIIRPRLALAGADLEECYFASKMEDGGEGVITLPHDAKKLERQIERIRPGLVVVDPVGAHLGGDTDANADSSVRRALAPLARIAAKHDTCIIFIHHVNKGRSRNPITRSGGSIGIIGVSRQALVMAKDMNDDDVRVIVGFKNNYGPDAEGRSYRVEFGEAEGHHAIRLTAPHPSKLKVHQLLSDGTGRDD